MSLEGPDGGGDELYLSKYDLLMYENAQLQVTTSLQAIGLKRAEMDRLKFEYESKRESLAKEVAQLAMMAKGHEETLRNVQESLQSLYNVDVKTMVYDDKTGKITILSEG